MASAQRLLTRPPARAALTAALLAGSLGAGASAHALAGSGSGAGSPAPATTVASRSVVVECEGVGQTRIRLAGDPAHATPRLAPGPLSLAGRPGFTGRDLAGRRVHRAPTGTGAVCTSRPGQVSGTLSFAVTVDAPAASSAPAATTSMAAAPTASMAAAPTASMAAATSGLVSTAVTTQPLPATLRSKVASALAARPGTASVAVHRIDTGRTYVYTKTRTSYYTASIVKVELMVGTMLKAQREGRALTAWEKSRIVPMIRYSDNATASDLYWYLGGRDGLTRLSQRLGMTSTVSYPTAGYWGLTTTTAADQTHLLRQLTTGPLLTTTNRQYALTQMRSVSADQDWGVTAGPPVGTVAVKNGWLPYRGFYNANSIGYSTYSSPDYTIAVLSSAYGGTLAGQTRTIENVSRLVWSHRGTL